MLPRESKGLCLHAATWVHLDDRAGLERWAGVASVLRWRWRWTVPAAVFMWLAAGYSTSSNSASAAM